jgi:hypothetical protein
LKSTLLIIFFSHFLLSLSALCQAPYKISGEIRTRIEGRDNADFNSERLDGAIFVLNRMRIGISREFEHGVNVFVQLQDSRLWGEEGSSLGALDAIDLHQAYFEIENVAGLPVDVRIGRQEFAFGSERLIGKFDWHNTGRAFDAARIIVGPETQNLHLWMAQVRDFNAPAIGRNQEFGGAYFSSQKILPGTFDAYALFFFDERNYNALADLDVPVERSEAGSKHLTLWTFGGRLETTPAQNWQVEIEGTYQLGNRGPLDIRAYGYAVESEYSFAAIAKPKLLAGYTFGSGDSNRNDSKIETFSNLFPDRHSFLGAMDYASWSNISAFYFGGAIQPSKDFEIGVKFYFISLSDDDDALYKAEGYRTGSPAEIFRTAVPGAGTEVGKEIDVFAKFVYRDRINVACGFSSFFVGKFLENTGGLRADDSYFGYFSLSVGF